MTDFCHIPLSHYYAFGEVMREPELCQCFLETVLEIKIRRLVFVEKEHEMSDTWSAHGIRLDVYVEDDANSVYSIEMQNDVETMKRVRYYQGNIDRYLLEKGQHYTMLKQSFIIMVCNYDAVGLGYPAYWRESVFKCPVGTGEYDDGSHVVLLNAKYDKKYAVDMPAVCEFLDLLNVEEDVPPETMEYPLGKLAAQGITRLRKTGEKGGANMFMTFEQKLKDEAFVARQKGWEDGEKAGEKKGRKEGRLEGINEGRKEGEKTVLRMLVDRGMISEEQAAKVLKEVATGEGNE